MKKKYLLGATTDNEIVFGEFEITTRNNYSEFTASFDTVRPFNGDNIDLIDYFEDFISDMDESYLYNACKNFDCAPSRLAENFADECNDPRDALDCSLYPKQFNINGNNWYFESSSCGQHDTRCEMKEFTNREAYDILHSLWDSYHLQKVDESIISQVEKLAKTLDEINEKEWITDYIKRNIDNFE